MLGALQGHGFRWRTGKDQLLLISIGTGSLKKTLPAQALLGMPAAEQGVRALQSLMSDCAQMNYGLLQWLNNCLTPWIIDRAVGDMKLDSQDGPQLASYARYNVLLEKDWLSSELGIELAPEKIEQIAGMDNPANMDELAKLGESAAKRQVKAEHLPAAFDLA